ncbi:hypothetical protein MSC49_36770 (plasmid) [Methylosinus sp. C49]|uniref:hypothetical protein n=1 Tax=Methylosinus sp. C49 TaxID=2699395 RepID=UPI0013673DBF|nr:hypothetical protein [Methylosinus sp. C49]BBU63742.1 hypothetical protein MSC49_36770 [Methylosinus sp. C49]
MTAAADRETLLVLSGDGPPPKAFDAPRAAGALTIVRQTELDDSRLVAARGLITTMHLDQVDFARRSIALETFFDRGGRLAFMGHLARPFLPELAPFVPLGAGRRADFALVALDEHAVFEGIDRARLETRRGVAGFYGRGHSPPPPGGHALTGVGPRAAPIDWAWERPAGGALLMHAGNDLWTVCDESSVNVALAERIVAWCAGATAIWS